MIRAFLLLASVVACAALAHANFALFQVSGTVVGWTTFTPTIGSGSCASGTYTGTCITYVSNSLGGGGSCTPQPPPQTDTPSAAILCQTLAAGMANLRTGNSDWLLLRRGDTWKDQALGLTNKAGVSSSQPILISAYGTSNSRPIVEPNPSINDRGIGSVFTGDYMAIVGIEFYAYTRDPGNVGFNSGTTSLELSGINFSPNGAPTIHYILVEDCYIHFFMNGIVVDFTSASGPPANINIRRNVIADSYNPSGHSQGIFAGVIQNVLVEENVLDHNGWNGTVAGGGATAFNRNAYLNYDITNITFRGNISTYGSSDGLQARSGGIVTNNYFAEGPEGFEVGHQAVDGGHTITSATVTNNVVQASDDANGVTPHGQGIIVLNASGSGVQVNSNIISQVVSVDGNIIGLQIDAFSSGVTANNNIVCQWSTTILDQGAGDSLSGNTTQAANCNGLGPNSNANAGTYAGTLGLTATLAGFLAAARGQSRLNWNPNLTACALNNYIRAGFSIAAACAPQ